MKVSDLAHKEYSLDDLKRCGPSPILSYSTQYLKNAKITPKMRGENGDIWEYAG